MDNLDIFICTHKDFESQVKNPSYRTIDSRLLRNVYKVSGVFDDKELSEQYHFNYVSHFVELKDYVGFCHYRRYFKFLDNLPDISDIFSKSEVIIETPIEFNVTNAEIYSSCHNQEDLKITESIIESKFSEYLEAYRNFMNSKHFSPGNMFIMKKSNFLDYADFMERFVNEWIAVVGTDMVKRVEENKEAYLKEGYPGNSVDYQSRIIGFIMERLTNVYIFNHFSNLAIADAVVTENKYNIEGSIF